MIRCGLNAPQDDGRALSEYLKSADAGNLNSVVQLGHMYRFGCAKANDGTVFAAYKKAADRGDPEAQIALSDLFFEGRGTDQTFYQAYMWARLAELRLPPGELRTSANVRVGHAGRVMSAFEIKDVEKFVQSSITTALTRQACGTHESCAGPR
jgi:hypothetical protein